MKTKYILPLILMSLQITNSNAQKNQNLSPLITNLANRQTIPLDGKWNYIVDPYDKGFLDYRLKESKWGYFLNSKPKSPSDLVEYDFDKSPTLNVPGDWNTQEPKLYYYEGTVWYKKSFNYQKKENKRVFLHFGAVNYDAVVYLNGKKLGRR